MIEQVFNLLSAFENVLWGYICIPLLFLLGIYLTWQSGIVQFRKFPTVVKTFFSFFKEAKTSQENGIHPLKVFFACVGGCVGIGNIVGICTAVQIGGPGALFWIWITALVGGMVKYAEVYLGLRYRVMTGQGQYSGGPMYFLQQVFKTPWIPQVVCLLLCIYGVELYQFNIVISTLSVNFGINEIVAVIGLLIMVVFAGNGGVQRVGAISSAIIPLFVIVYLSMGAWVLFNHLSILPSILSTVVTTAFTGHAAIGGFVGSTLIMALSQGVRRGCYTGDLGVGYASVIHSESSVKVPEIQASLVILDVFLDTFLICTSSVLVILVTDIWYQPMDEGLLVQTALAQHFPYMHFFMPFFLFLLGYSTINAYYCVGLKCASYLSPRRGRLIYNIYAILSLLIFSFLDSRHAQSIMTISGGLLLILNCYGIFRMRREISYNLENPKPSLQPIIVQEM
jgi:alanine or glycine:cation symporter, AGCS family